MKSNCLGWPGRKLHLLSCTWLFFKHSNHRSVLVLRLQGHFRNSALSLFVQKTAWSYTNRTSQTQVLPISNYETYSSFFSLQKAFLFSLFQSNRLLSFEVVGKSPSCNLVSSSIPNPLQDVSAMACFPSLHIQRMLMGQIAQIKALRGSSKLKCCGLHSVTSHKHSAHSFLWAAQNRRCKQLKAKLQHN